jgi:hypothetical protein
LPFDENSLLHYLLDFRKYSDLLGWKTMLRVSGAVVDDPEMWVKFIKNLRLFVNDAVSMACMAGYIVKAWTKTGSMDKDFYCL